MAKVIKRLKGNNSNPVGTLHNNPILNTSEYTIEMYDGSSQELNDNIIAESMFTQVNSEGHHYQLLKEITDHRKYRSEIPISDGMIPSNNGNVVPKKTSRGWDLLVEWKDVSSIWIPLKDFKSSSPVELSKYAAGNRLDVEPTFKWWVRDVLRRRNRIIAKVKAKYWRTTHKFGIRVPKYVDEALPIDKENVNTLWYTAIQKEMNDVHVAFEAWEEVSLDDSRHGQNLVGYQEIRCHMIFYIKMDRRLTRKACYVSFSQTTDPPPSITYSRVVSRDSIRIAFTLAALKDVDIRAADIGNEYLNAKCREKIWTIAGTEFVS